MTNQAPSDQSDSLVGHLYELRKCLLNSLLGIVVAFVGCWAFSEIIFDFIRGPISPFLEHSGGGLVFTAPMDKFLAHLKVSFLAAFIVSSPWWLWQLWKFISPALYDSEKSFGIYFILFGTFLFISGVSFVYYVVYPLAFKFLMNFGGGLDAPMITIKEYLSFFVTTTLVFGLAFEMPLILSLLGRFGVIDKSFLQRNRRYGIVLLSILSAFITPPDVISMLLMMAPMLLLYELSVILVGIMQPKESA